jgi:hypothetical protein
VSAGGQKIRGLERWPHDPSDELWVAALARWALFAEKTEKTLRKSRNQQNWSEETSTFDHTTETL